jgi:N-methylhydantoinase A/oxoprolinase/acetone carboxylase beta subunit
LVDAFHARHMEVYGHMNKEAAVEVVNLRTVHRVPVAPPGFAFQGGRSLAAGQRRRSAYFDGQWVETPVLDRAELPSGVPLAGPAIIEQPDTTTVVYPHQVATLDPVGNILLESRA